MYAKIIRVKCSHSSKPLHGCEIFRKNARLLGAYVVRRCFVTPSFFNHILVDIILVENIRPHEYNK